MKNLKFLVMLLVAVLFVPFTVFATDEDATSKEVPLYFFRGDGCPHCEDAEKWFASIEAEYGSYFNIVDYEVWNNEDNAALMEKVATARGESAEGVPYIIIGDKSWNGFDPSYEEEMIEQIKEVYAQDTAKRYDVMNYVDSDTNKDKKSESNASNVLVLIIILLVVAGTGFGIYKARKTTK